MTSSKGIDMDEIRKQLELYWEERYYDENQHSTPNAIKRFATLLHQAEVKARIDEVSKAIDWFDNESGDLFYLEDQLSSLRREGEE